MTKGEHIFNMGCYVLFIAIFAAIFEYLRPQVSVPAMIGTIGIIDIIKGLVVKRREGDWFR